MESPKVASAAGGDASRRPAPPTKAMPARLGVPAPTLCKLLGFPESQSFHMQNGHHTFLTRSLRRFKLTYKHLTH